MSDKIDLSLTPEEYEFYKSENVTNVVVLNSDLALSAEDLESADFPVLGLWSIVLVLSAMITCGAFYLSYWCHKKRQQRLASRHHQNFSNNKGESVDLCASPDEIEAGLFVKVSLAGLCM